jgi:hypothetical protein
VYDDRCHMTESKSDRRRRFAAKVGPHMQVGETRTVEVPAQPGVMAHRDFLATTVCGRDDVASTLVTQTRDRVRCPDCLAEMGDLLCPGGEGHD